MEENEFDNIRPYSDEEARAAFQRIADNPILPTISKYLFPREKADFMSGLIRQPQTIDQFQTGVMIGVINAVFAKTSEGFTYSGQDNLKELKGKKCIFMSNHRDIVIDPALIQYTMRDLGLPYTEICVGSNLLYNSLLEDLMRSNRMIKVIRGISARELYLSSQKLSKYIRNSITTGSASVWIAQREGRTKNGYDSTEQGLLKMFDLSGTGSFIENFSSINIVPVSISYELEPCDAKKAREIFISRTEKYVKKPGEDLHSILTGIRQPKGHIHLHFGKMLSSQEITEAAGLNGNDRYQVLMHVIDKRIHSGYRLYKTNYIGYDLMNGTSEYLGKKYLHEELEDFKNYAEHKLDKVEKRLNRNELRQIFYSIYGNPVVAKKQR